MGISAMSVAFVSGLPAWIIKAAAAATATFAPADGLIWLVLEELYCQNPSQLLTIPLFCQLYYCLKEHPPTPLTAKEILR